MIGVVQTGQILMYEGQVTSDTDSKGLGRVDVIAPARWGAGNTIRRVKPIFPVFVWGGVPKKDDVVRILEFPGNQLFYMSLALTEPADWFAVERVGFSSRAGDVQAGIQSDTKEVRLGSFDATLMATIWEPLRAILLAILGNLDQLNGHGHKIPIGGVVVSGSPSTQSNAAIITVPAVTNCNYGTARTDVEGDEPGSDVVRLIKDKP